MNDQQFKKRCQFWHNKTRSLIKQGNYDKVSEYKESIKKALSEWRDQERLARNRGHILSALLVSIMQEEKKFGGNRK